MSGWSGRTRGRLIALFWLFAFLYMLLMGRLAHLQYFDNAAYAAMAKAQQETVVQINAVRGDIRDCNNAVLARSLVLTSIAVNPNLVENKPQAASLLASAIGIGEKDLLKTLGFPCTFQWVARKVPDEIAKKVEELKVPGVFLIKEPTPGRRYYPKGRLLSQLLGATGVDDQGLDGLEGSYDKYLGGEPGKIRSFVDRDGWIMPVGENGVVKKTVPGRHLVLTIDEGIQYVAERELAKAVKERHAKGGICIVMDVKTGGLLAMAIAPDFPASDFAKVPPALRRNRAITDPYEPGSTFKVFLASAAVVAGVSPEERFQSGGVLSIGGWTIHNAMDGLEAAGSETLSDIIAFSFNVGTASVAMRIGKKNLSKTLDAFGFGQCTGVDLQGEAEGILAPVKTWSDINTATISFGQGVAVTPLQLVSALQAVGNKGVRLRPHVVKAIINPDGTIYKEVKPKAISRPLTPDQAQRVIGILRGVCDKGTGKKANVPGYRVCGKTGTAQVVRGGVYDGAAFIGSFLGMAPADDPRLAILVKIEEPTPVYWGGVVAGPVFKAVAQESLWRLGIAPSHPEEITAQQSKDDEKAKTIVAAQKPAEKQGEKHGQR